MLLDVRDLSVRHGQIEALHRVSLALDEGEIVTVIGPNGAGKTTLLRAIAGALRPAGGRVTLAGRDVTGRPSWEIVRAGVALVPEGRGIFGDQSVRDNLVLGAVSHRRFAMLEEVLAGFPALRPRLDTPAGALSGGQQQMLAIARGLMARPRLLLLDEPSLGLAPRLVRETFAQVRRIREQGVAVLLVEQMGLQALEVADRGYVLERGQVVAEGAARDLAQDARVITAYLGARRSR
jgi:branched-chain amino acid transport system ATP-binding protein